jgi:hypothetical protein
LNLFQKESATLANRLIEGQVMNAQYAEEIYQLKREYSALKRQFEDKNSPNVDKTIIQNNHHNLSNSIFTPQDEELEVLQQTVDRLAAVGFFYFLSTIFSDISIGKSKFKIQSTY